MRKKPQKQRQKERKLAVLPPLNQEETKNKEVMMIDIDGRMSLQINEEIEPSTTTDPSTTIDKTFAKVSHQSQQEQEQKLNKQDDLEFKECYSCKAQCNTILELQEALEKSSQFVSADKMESTYDNDRNTINDILPFEFFMPYKKILNYMIPLFQKTGDGGEVWFNGKIDKKTGKVISANPGRIDQQ